MKDSPSERIVLIDGLRSLSIVLVLALHLGIARFSLGLDHPVPHYWNLFARNGAYGVSIFFTISGFLITRILMRTRPDFSSISYSDFYARRTGRILPLLGWVVLSGVLLVYAPFTHSGAWSFCVDPAGSLKRVLLSITTFSFNWYDIWNSTLRGGIGMHWGVLWSLSIEEQFYFFYPLLLRRLASLQKVLVCLIVLIVGGFLYRGWASWFHPNIAFLGLEGSFGAFDQIAAGSVLFFISRSTMAWMKKHPFIALSFVCIGAMIVGWTYLSTNLYHPKGRFIGPSAMSLGIFLFLWGGLSFEIDDAFPWNALCHPGKLSYGIYLLHSSVIFFGWSTIRQANPWLAFILFFTANILVAQLSYSFYELPANYWTRLRFHKLFKRFEA